jgi:hypothetical protein
VALYPYVPPYPGVPPVYRDASNSSFPPIAVLTADAPGVLATTATTPQWGIFSSSGVSALQPDSVLSFRFRREFEDSDFPIEQGSFGTYNKVAHPFEAWGTMVKGGTISARSDFLNALQTMNADTSLYIFVTPEISYPNVNMELQDYERTSEQGFQLIKADVHMVETRIAPAPQFSNTASPTAQGQTNNGSVQPQVPSAGQVSQAQSSFSTSQGVGVLVPGQPAGSV